MTDRIASSARSPAPRPRPPVPAVVEAEPWPEPADLARAKAAYLGRDRPGALPPDPGERRHLGWL